MRQIWPRWDRDKAKSARRKADHLRVARAFWTDGWEIPAVLQEDGAPKMLSATAFLLPAEMSFAVTMRLWQLRWIQAREEKAFVRLPTEYCALVRECCHRRSVRLNVWRGSPFNRRTATAKKPQRPSHTSLYSVGHKVPELLSLFDRNTLQ